MTIEEVGVAWKREGPTIRLEVIAKHHVLDVPRVLQLTMGGTIFLLQDLPDILHHTRRDSWRRQCRELCKSQ